MLSQHLGVDARSVHAYIIGEHGDSEVPVWSLGQRGRHAPAGVLQSPATPLRPADHGRRSSRQTRDAAYHIIERKGATYYAVAAGLMRIAQAILRDQNTVLSVSSLIEDYYGIDDVCFSLPTVLDRGGVESVLLLDLDQQEQQKLRHSDEVLRQTIAALNLGCGVG